MENNQEYNDKHCFVCGLSFGLLTRGKQCSTCMNFVCKKHYIKCENSLMCIQCEINSIKAQRKQEIQKEIQAISDQIKSSTQDLQNVNSEKHEKIKTIEKIEYELLENEKTYTNTITELDQKYTQTHLKLEKIRIEHEKINKDLKSNNTLAEEYRQETKTIELKIQELEKQLIEAKEKKQNYGLQIDHLNKKLLGSLPVDSLETILCGKCKSVLEANNLDQKVLE
jgi:chromosome segregation ATPase